MKKLMVGLLFIAGLAGVAEAQVWVDGYTRRDGTYVPPHYRSTPDRSYNNNWSVRPNINPYTGQMGTRQPTWNDRPPGSNYGFGNSYGTSRRGYGSGRNRW